MKRPKDKGSISYKEQQKHKKKLNEFIEEPEEPVRFEDEDEEKND